jgi:hypothetical protein
MLTGFTTLDAFKTFWPDVVNEFPTGILDQQLAIFQLRAEILLNKAGTLNTSYSDFSVVMDLATKLLMRRLIYWDKHPSASAEPAGVRRESASGLTYSMEPNDRTLDQILGEEITALVAGGAITINDMAIAATSQQIFTDPLLTVFDAAGKQVQIFDPSITDHRYSSFESCPDVWGPNSCAEWWNRPANLFGLDCASGC